MKQERVGDIRLSVSYAVKQAHVAMRTGMEAVLRPLDLTVPQYACLEQLGRHPGLSNSDLARGAFVSRQSMNLVVRRLQERELLTRPDEAPQGRARPTELTPDGKTLLYAASVAVREVEKRLFSPLTADQQDRLREELIACVRSSNHDPLSAS